LIFEVIADDADDADGTVASVSGFAETISDANAVAQVKAFVARDAQARTC